MPPHFNPHKVISERSRQFVISREQPLGDEPREHSAVRSGEDLAVWGSHLDVHAVGATSQYYGLAQSDLESEGVAFKHGPASLGHAKRGATAKIAAALHELRQSERVQHIEDRCRCLRLGFEAG